ncbi:glycine C-acetyltransferase [Parvularcula dongshanensis]|uniref:2-amino-3-ketobutyrate coenzyme A ligase n=1 Tax=Parvularcula dongshanensis TaxID=1173995 RepID=A0A840I2W1_9PROT|nr:glycine C-acetyltransferase [Parvularcula dongshanensis]MBB4659179.1 glycine C-acetyltransferase [Parvularcula dongshanensis]
MSAAFYDRIDAEIDETKSAGLYKTERLIEGKQGPTICVQGREVLNFCANNYLGLADDAGLAEAAKETMDTHGFGLASVRFICGTQDIHRVLEREIATWLGFDDSITFAACFDANGGVFEPLLGPEDAIISDALNHASIIDGVRLCKAKRYRYANNDMDDLEAQLRKADEDGARTKLVVTDGVFSMDGVICDLAGLCAVAKRYDALVMVDDCHATGVLGETGRGTAEHAGVMGQVDILTSTLGKALGGGMGGFICARQNVVDLLRQRARPYLFSNALTPALVGASRRAIAMVRDGDALRRQLVRNAERFRSRMAQSGFDLIPGEHPIIPVMLHEAPLAQEMATRLMEEGVYVTGFFYPVVPKGKARIRTQMSAAHTDEQVDACVDAFVRIGRQLGVIGRKGA